MAWGLAQEKGLAEFTLRDVATRVGMRAPSLYTHFESKHAIYDAMFGQAWTEYETLAQAELADLPRRPVPRCVELPGPSSTSRSPTPRGTNS